MTWRRMEEWMCRSTFCWPLHSWRWMVSFTSLPLYPPKKAPVTLWIGGWVDPRACLDDMENFKYLTLPGLKHRTLGRIASRYTDWATMVLPEKVPYLFTSWTTVSFSRKAPLLRDGRHFVSPDERSSSPERPIQFIRLNPYIALR
jgi:hypothetical protein